MPAYKIEILSPAYLDIDRIAEFHLRMVGPQSAQKITDKLLDTIGLLGEHPFAGAEHGDSVLQKQGYRKLICGEYICIYRVINDIVFIYRVVHGATDYPKWFE